MGTMETVLVWVQILGLPIAIIGILISVRSAARSQDIQVILSFVDSFREKWEGGWADLLDELEAKGLDKLPKAKVQHLRYMLNWIDWVGRLSMKHVLKNEAIILGSLKISLLRAIRLSEPMIAADTKEHGDEFWAGVHFVKSRLEKL